MAFAIASKEKLQGVGMSCVIVKYTNSTSTGGAIASGLSRVVGVVFGAGSSTSTVPCYSISGGTVTITTGNNDSGTVVIYGV